MALTDELKEKYTARYTELEAKRDALMDKIADASGGVSSASISGGAGSKSYSNKSISELREALKAVNMELARLYALLNGLPAPGAIRRHYATFNG